MFDFQMKPCKWENDITANNCEKKRGQQHAKEISSNLVPLQDTSLLREIYGLSLYTNIPRSIPYWDHHARLRVWRSRSANTWRGLVL